LSRNRGLKIEKALESRDMTTIIRVKMMVEFSIITEKTSLFDSVPYTRNTASPIVF
jgi:hypothetical protein